MTTTKFELKLGAATREAFGKALVEVGRKNPNVVALDADLSKSTYSTYFAQQFPERFFECGIAESNMVAIAAGLASSGKIPFASSFSAFVLTKGFEQLRVTAAFPNVNVKIVGTHSGISIGEDGPSQMSVEDLSLACSLPGFTVLCPADEVSMNALIHAAADHEAGLAGHDLRGGRVHGLETRGAEAVDRHAGNGLGEAGHHRRGAGDVGALLADRHDAAQDDVVDLAGVELAALLQRLQRRHGELHRGHFVQRTVLAALAARRADGVVDVCVGHGVSP